MVTDKTEEKLWEEKCREIASSVGDDCIASAARS